MTLVVDASAVAEILLGTRRGIAAARLIADERLVAPQLLTVEVASVLRGWSLGGYLSDHEARRALAEFALLGIERLDMEPLLVRVWELRHNLTAYDAMYVALARALDARLLTLDTRLASAAPDCAVVPDGGAAQGH